MRNGMQLFAVMLRKCAFLHFNVTLNVVVLFRALVFLRILKAAGVRW